MKCVIKSCAVNHNMGKRIYKFPKDELLRRKWLEAMGMAADLHVTTRMGVCEDHFTPESDVYGNTIQAFNTKFRLSLLPDAVPVPEKTLMISKAVAQGDLLFSSASASSISCRNEDDGDMFQCGKCDRQFFSLKLFLDHKRTSCVSQSGQAAHTESVSLTNLEVLNATNNPSVSCKVGTEQVGGTVTEFSNVVMNEAEFLSLTGIDISTLAIPNLSGVAVSNVFVTNTGTSPIKCADGDVTSDFQIVGLPPVSNSSDTLLATHTDRDAQTSALKAQTTVPGNQDVTPTLPLGIRPSEPCSAKAVCDKPFQTESCSDLLHSIISLYGESSMKETVEIQADASIAEGHADEGHGDTVVDEFLSTERNFDEHNTLNVSAETEMPMTLMKCAALEQNVRLQPSNQMNLQCNYCDKFFTKNFDLQQHVRSHTGEKPFQCIICGKAFAQKSNVKKHMSTHKVWPTELLHVLPRHLDSADDPPALNKSNETGVSPTCTKDVQQRAGVDESIQLQDKISDTYYCQFCNECFTTYCRLKSHLNTHNNHKVFRCVVKTCGKLFQDLDIFLDHAKAHVNEKSYQCHMCNKTFLTLYDYGLHQHTHRSLYKEKCKPRRFRCTKCIKQYSTEEALEHHMVIASHHNECPMCQKVFPSERYLRRHLITHDNASGAHRCSKCQKILKTQTCLKTHMLIHSKSTPFGCAHCPKMFNRKDKLKRHMLIHDPVKHYKCPFRKLTGCIKEFHRPDKLKAHLVTHSGIKQFKCQHCRQSFSRAVNMRKHQQLYKGKCAEKVPFHCSVCKEAFNTKACLKEHKCRISSSIQKTGTKFKERNISVRETIVYSGKYKGGQELHLESTSKRKGVTSTVPEEMKKSSEIRVSSNEQSSLDLASIDITIDDQENTNCLQGVQFTREDMPNSILKEDVADVPFMLQTKVGAENNAKISHDVPSAFDSGQSSVLAALLKHC